MIKTFIFLFLSLNNTLICSIMVLCLCFLWNLTFFPRKTPLVAQMVKRLAYSAGDLGLIPGLGRSSGEEMATHSSTLAWKIPWTEEHGRLQSMRLQSQTRLRNFTFPRENKDLFQLLISNLAQI